MIEVKLVFEESEDILWDLEIWIWPSNLISEASCPFFFLQPYNIWLNFLLSVFESFLSLVPLWCMRKFYANSLSQTILFPFAVELITFFCLAIWYFRYFIPRILKTLCGSFFVSFSSFFIIQAKSLFPFHFRLFRVSDEGEENISHLFIRW